MRLTILGHAFSTCARRELQGWQIRATNLFAAGFAAWSCYACLFSNLEVLLLTIVFLAGMLMLVFALMAPGITKPGVAANFVDGGLIAMSLAAGLYFVLAKDEISQRIALFDPLTTADLFWGTAILVLSVEACRRTVGLGLTAFAVLLVAYNLYGHLLPGAAGHGYISYSHFLDLMVFGTDGLFGAPLRVAATYVFMFVLFGTVLNKVGGARFFYDIAALCAGRQRGGLGKIAVVSSGLFGTISGSPTSDVLTTGAITIPAMTAGRYPARLAGGIEVAASTGGGLLPPVMGSAAFLMAEIAGIPYATIALAAVLPALFFYLGIFTQLHLRACRLNLRPIESSLVPTMSATLARGWTFIVPLVVIVIALSKGYTPIWSAAFAIVSLALCALPKAAISNLLHDLAGSLSEASKRVAPVAGACAAAGIIIGCLTMSGLAGKIAAQISMMAGNNLFAVQLSAAAISLLLGMGMPVPSAYLLAAAVAAPAMIGTGIPELHAHLFLLYFSVMSALTPPIAVAAFAASSIADENPFAIAMEAMRLVISGFVIPFAFVRFPDLLTHENIAGLVGACLSLSVAVSLLALAAEGFLGGRLHPVERLAFLLAAPLFIHAGNMAIIAGIILTLGGGLRSAVLVLGPRK